MHLFEYYFEGTKTGDWMLMYQVVAKDRAEAELEIKKAAMLNDYDAVNLKSMRCTMKLLPERLIAIVSKHETKTAASNVTVERETKKDYGHRDVVVSQNKDVAKTK